MSKEMQLSRRGFIRQATMTAGGILVAGAAGDLLAGCGGGGLNGATPGSSLPAVPVKVPKTPAQAIPGFSGKTGIPVSLVKVQVTGTVSTANLSATVDSLTAPGELTLVNGKLETVASSGLTAAQIANFENKLTASGLSLIHI